MRDIVSLVVAVLTFVMVALNFRVSIKQTDEIGVLKKENAELRSALEAK